MHVSFTSTLKTFLHRLWGKWSAIQEREDEVWRSETGEDGSGLEAEVCEVPKPTDNVDSGGALDLDVLIEQRNAEYGNSKGTTKSEDD